MLVLFSCERIDAQPSQHESESGRQSSSYSDFTKINQRSNNPQNINENKDKGMTHIRIPWLNSPLDTFETPNRFVKRQQSYLASPPAYVGCMQDNEISVFNQSSEWNNTISGWNVLYYCQYQAILNGAYYFATARNKMCFYGSSATQINKYGSLLGQGSCKSVCSSIYNTIIPGAYIGPNCGGYNYVVSLYQTLVIAIYTIYPHIYSQLPTRVKW